MNSLATSKSARAIALINRSGFESVIDKNLRSTIEKLKSHKTELEEISAIIKKELSLPIDRKRKFLAQLVYSVTPESFYQWLPDRVTKMVAEEFDALEFLEGLMRQNVNNTQSALQELANTALKKSEEVENLESDIGKAIGENWDAQTLQKFMAEKADVQIYSEVANLLAEEFNALTAEDKEKRKTELLSQLQSNVDLGKKLVSALGKVCNAGLQIFHQGVAQYYNYTNFYRPISVIRDAASTMVDMNESMYSARDALKMTFNASIEAIETAIDAAKLIRQYSLSGVDMKKIIESGQTRLEKKLEELDSKRDKVLKLDYPIVADAKIIS
jgi:hypothetical protein